MKLTQVSGPPLVGIFLGLLWSLAVGLAAAVVLGAVVLVLAPGARATVNETPDLGPPVGLEDVGQGNLLFRTERPGLFLVNALLGQ